MIDIPQQTRISPTQSYGTYMAPGSSMNSGRYAQSQGIPYQGSHVHDMQQSDADKERLYNHDRRELYPQASRSLSNHSNYIMLDNGSVRKIPGLRATESENPLHTSAMGKVTDPSGIWKVLSPIYMIRYLSDGVMKASFGPFMHHGSRGNFISENVSKTIDSISGRGLDAVKEFATKAEQYVTEQGINVEDLSSGYNFDALKAIDPKGYEKALGTLGTAGHPFDSPEQLQSLIEKLHDSPDAFNKELNGVKKDFLQNVNRTGFDALLGTAGTIGTLWYGHRVYNNFKRLYSETVAYEIYDEGKSPSDIDFADFFRTQNKIVKESWNDFLGKNMIRLVTDGAFFGRSIGHVMDNDLMKSIPFGEIMLGLKGVLLLTETTRRHTSILDDLLHLVDNKLSPRHGMGEPVTSADLLNIHQKYQMVHNPNKMFHDATRHDIEDDAKWRQASLLFERMADMMNQTYKYKHHVNPNSSPLKQIEDQIEAKYQYFVLPKFLYLLGHDLIDVSEPERTLALAEITNQYSVQEVKNLLREEEQTKEPFFELLKKRPIDLQKTFGEDSVPEVIEISEIARSFKYGVINKFLNEHENVRELYEEIADHELSNIPLHHLKQDGTVESMAGLLQDTMEMIDQANLDYGPSKVIPTAIVPRRAHNNIVPFDRQHPYMDDTPYNNIQSFNRQPEPAYAQRQAQMAESTIISRPTQQQAEPAASLPQLSFFPAHSRSVPSHHNDAPSMQQQTRNTTAPNYMVRDAERTERMLGGEIPTQQR